MDHLTRRKLLLGAGATIAAPALLPLAGLPVATPLPFHPPAPVVGDYVLIAHEGREAVLYVTGLSGDWIIEAGKQAVLTPTAAGWKRLNPP